MFLRLNSAFERITGPFKFCNQSAVAAADAARPCRGSLMCDEYPLLTVVCLSLGPPLLLRRPPSPLKGP